MFNKKSCKKCGERINKNYKFCPGCGLKLGKNSENWGILGRSDDINEFEQFSREMLGGISGGMLGKMFEGAMKMLEKEMQKEMKNIKHQPRTDIQLFINGKRINLNQLQEEKRVKKIPVIELPKANLKLSNLPREEPITNIRRLSDKVIYEIDIPGVKSEEEISIIPLENSIEIKALGKGKAYSKLIPINMPIINYALSKGKLVLEFGVRG